MNRPPSAAQARVFDPRHNNFDLLRLFAASQVAFVHVSSNLEIHFTGFWHWFRQALDYFPGVPIFFIISGFLISASLDRNPNLRDYAVNRCLRIYPALWMATALTLVVLLATGNRIWEAIGQSGANPLWVTGQWLAAQFSIAQFWNPAAFKNFGVGQINGSLWTIPVELQFYCALPLLAPWLWRGWSVAAQNLRLSLATAALFAFANYYAAHPEVFAAIDTRLPVLIRLSLLPYLPIFLLGIFIQRNQEALARWLDGKGILWLAAYVALAHGKGYLHDRPIDSYADPLLLAVLAMTVVSIAFSGRNLAGRLLRGNDISYGTYIYHAVLLNIAYEYGYRGSATAMAAVLAASYLIAWLSWRFLEEPALGLKHRPLLARGHHAPK